MKRLMTLVLVLGLTVLAPLSALGAIHDSAGDFGEWYWPNILGGGMLNFNNVVVDHWFKVDKDYSYWKAVGNFGDLGLLDLDVESLSVTQLAGEYYCNDQTFAEIVLDWFSTAPWRQDGESVAGNFASVKGTYLAESDFFIGMNYASGISQNTTIIAPGYKFKFNESNYLAFSLDYVMLDPSPFSGDNLYTTSGWDVDFKYFTSNGKTKMVGQAYIFSDDYFAPDGATQLDFALNHKFNNQWVVGGFVGIYNEYWTIYSDYQNDATVIGAGLTFTPNINWVFDGRFSIWDVEGLPDEATLAELSGMYQVNNQLRIGAGFNVDSDINDPAIFAKFVWLVGGGNFDFSYQLPNQTFGSELFIGYKKVLK